MKPVDSLFAAIPPRFHEAVARIHALQRQDRYLAAFIFGSVARRETTAASDLDVCVITKEDNDPISILHLRIGGVKLDLSFYSMDQMSQQNKKALKKIPRVRPMLAESIVVFDKTGQLDVLRQEALRVMPAKHDEEELPHLRFLIYHMDDKVRRNVIQDPASAQLAIHMCLAELIDFHYGLQGHWRVSSKRILADLDAWDPSGAHLLRMLVIEPDLLGKFRLWSRFIDHVLEPFGGRGDISENPHVSACSVQGLRDLMAAA